MGSDLRNGGDQGFHNDLRLLIDTVIQPGNNVNSYDALRERLASQHRGSVSLHDGFAAAQAMTMAL